MVKDDLVNLKNTLYMFKSAVCFHLDSSNEIKQNEFSLFALGVYNSVEDLETKINLILDKIEK